LTDAAQINEAFLQEQFSSISTWLYDATGIEIPIDRLKFDIYDNPRGHKSCEGRVYYQSYFAGGKRSIPKIKFDLTADEVLVLPPSRQKVFHPYSDLPPDDIHIDCYSYPEVFGEKVRALGERGRPRDLYDVINLYRNDQLPAAAVIQEVLAQKCAYKSIGLPTIVEMEAYKDALQGNWGNMLAHQLPSLPTLEIYWSALPEFFDWLEGKTVEDKAPLTTMPGSGNLYRPVYGRLGLRALSGNSLEIIRFAAGNRLCVDLDYTDKSGRRSTRSIEPYSLKQTNDGNILLHAIRTEDSEPRSYRIDQINDASITNEVFVPRYQVELSPSGDISHLEQSSGAANSLGLLSRSSGFSGASRRTPRRRQSNFSGVPIYVYRCPMCSKKFKRKKPNAKLNPHKSKDGWPCSGRMGYFEETIY